MELFKVLIRYKDAENVRGHGESTAEVLVAVHGAFGNEMVCTASKLAIEKRLSIDPEYVKEKSVVVESVERIGAIHVEGA